MSEMPKETVWLRIDRATAKLAEFDVVSIREQRAAGERLAKLARDFGVSASLVGQICQRKLWSHI